MAVIVVYGNRFGCPYYVGNNAFWMEFVMVGYQAKKISRMTYNLDVPIKPPKKLIAELRNQTLEEVASEFDKMRNGGDTTAGFAIFIRSMKSG